MKNGAMIPRSIKVGVVMGGSSEERSISLKTGKAISRSLIRQGYRVFELEADRDLPRQLRLKKISVAFLALHGPGGEDGTVQGLLEVMKIPYTGSGVSASAMCMDKGLTRMALQAANIPVPPGVTLQAPFVPADPPARLGWPVVVKPCRQGSTIGVSIVRRRSQWNQALVKAFGYGDQVVAEKYIPGREVAIGVFGERVFPGVEVIAPGGFYDFQAKYGKASTRYVCPAPISGRVRRRLEAYTLQAYQALGCRGAARVDFRMHSNGRPYVLELNTIPGMTKRSLLPMAAAQMGMSYDELVDAILQDAILNGGGRSSLRAKSKKRNRE